MTARLGRLALGLLCAASATAAAEPAPKADPAFLGVVMGAGPGIGSCHLKGITTGSPAVEAGLQRWDRVIAIDGQPVLDCNRLSEIIAAHDQDDVVSITVQRPDDALTSTSRRITVTATLSSRSQVMRRAYLGHPLAMAVVDTDTDASRSLDLGAPRGRAGIVGWFDPSCADACARVFAQVAKWARGKRAVAYAVTYWENRAMPRTQADVEALRARHRLEIPLAVADDPSVETGSEPTSNPMIFERDRMMFAVIDPTGVVSYIASIAPASDDLDAALDELFVAADYAYRR